MTIYHSIQKKAVNKQRIIKYFFNFQNQNSLLSANEALQAFLAFTNELPHDVRHRPDLT